MRPLQRRRDRARAAPASQRQLANVRSARSSPAIALGAGLVPARRSPRRPAPCNGVAADLRRQGRRPPRELRRAGGVVLRGRPAGCRPSSRSSSATGRPRTRTPSRRASRCSSTVGGQTRFVRSTAPPPAAGPLRYDYGTWTHGRRLRERRRDDRRGRRRPGGHASRSTCPAATGAVAGARARAAVRHDLRRRHAGRAALGRSRARRGVTPRPRRRSAPTTSSARAAGRAGGGGPGPGGADDARRPGQTAPTTSVVLDAPKRLVGGGRCARAGASCPRAAA